MRKKIFTHLFLTLGLSASLSLAAQQLDTSKLEKLGIQVGEVSETSISGLYQITSNQGIFYVSKDGNRLLAGNLFDLTKEQPENLTEQAMAELRQQQLQRVEDEMVVYPASDEKYEITVFTDTTCGYCQRMHENLGQYLDRGITVRYLAFPRGGMNSKGGRELQTVWCADEPAKALTKLKSGEQVDSRSCDNPVASHYRMGQAFGVTGTPAIVLPDGRMLPGLRTADALVEQMQ
ncbi:bifunctional protein-disulfide isomerase/oxidoreductase DsbC [Idiomarina seosinensis]|uniref:bifunctional protein-disulfide isomerase/oxidoreductase DsbC n=1 Tax=Idiomarina seosinensis TaxID=281739 RepID=UPI00385086C7